MNFKEFQKKIDWALTETECKDEDLIDVYNAMRLSDGLISNIYTMDLFDYYNNDLSEEDLEVYLVNSSPYFSKKDKYFVRNDTDQRFYSGNKATELLDIMWFGGLADDYEDYFAELEDRYKEEK